MRKKSKKKKTERNKKEFDKFMAPYIEEGLVTPIYETEELMIMNIANIVYCAADYLLLDEHKPAALIVEQKYLRYLMTEDNAFTKYCLSLGKKEYVKHYMVFNKSTHEKMKEYKKLTDENGPCVDLEHERNLVNEIKEANSSEA